MRIKNDRMFKTENSLNEEWKFIISETHNLKNYKSQDVKNRLFNLQILLSILAGEKNKSDRYKLEVVYLMLKKEYLNLAN